LVVWKGNILCGLVFLFAEKKGDKYMELKQMGLFLISSLLIISLSGMASAVNPVVTDQTRGPGNTMHSNHTSVLSVTETITNLEDDYYQYSYSFINTENKPIWHFLVETPFPITDDVTPFNGKLSMNAGFFELNSPNIHNIYDARNLDGSLLMGANTWTNSFQDELQSIQVGESVSGFSYIAATYDPGPKLYAYETIDNYAVNSGKVTAYGNTSTSTTHNIPEFPSIALPIAAIFGLVFLFGKREN